MMHQTKQQNTLVSEVFCRMLDVYEVMAGPELDALIQEKVFNLPTDADVPPYSQNTETATWLAERFHLVVRPVIKMRGPGPGTAGDDVAGYFTVRRSHEGEDGKRFGMQFLATAETKELAICRGVLQIHGLADEGGEKVFTDHPRDTVKN